MHDRVWHLVHLGLCNGYASSEAPFINGITQEDAFTLFTVDLSEAGERIVKKYVTVPLKQNEYDALVSFAYNVGEGYGQELTDPGYALGFSNSTLLEELNKGNFDLVPVELNKWILPISAVGLVLRRQQEGKIFIENIYDSTH